MSDDEKHNAERAKPFISIGFPKPVDTRHFYSKDELQQFIDTEAAKWSFVNGLSKENNEFKFVRAAYNRLIELQQYLRTTGLEEEQQSYLDELHRRIPRYNRISWMKFS